MVIINLIHGFLSFYIVVSNCEEWKEEAFSWSVPGDSQNRRQRVVNRGTLRLSGGGFAFVQGGIYIQN